MSAELQGLTTCCGQGDFATAAGAGRGDLLLARTLCERGWKRELGTPGARRDRTEPKELDFGDRPARWLRPPRAVPRPFHRGWDDCAPRTCPRRWGAEDGPFLSGGLKTQRPSSAWLGAEWPGLQIAGMGVAPQPMAGARDGPVSTSWTRAAFTKYLNEVFLLY